jgi:ATP-dependent Zn protease
MNKSKFRYVIIFVICGLIFIRFSALSKSGLEYNLFISELNKGNIANVKLQANPQLLPASYFGTIASAKTQQRKSCTFNIPANEDRVIRLIIDNVKGNIDIPHTNNVSVWHSELTRLFAMYMVVAFAIARFTEHRMNTKQILISRLVIFCICVSYVIITISTQLFSIPTIHNPLPYSKLIQKLQAGEIASVSLNVDRSRAIVDDKDRYRDIVNLPPDERLKEILTANIQGKIDTLPDDRFNQIVLKNNVKVRGYRDNNT